jgi:glycosyltransferase involved in cell wall biosynthesis
MLPVKLLEFAMMGIPAIAPSLKTVEYYFGNGSVRFFRPGDISDLADAIEQLYRSPDLRRTYAENARKVVDAISWPNQRGEFYRAIDSIVPRHKEGLDPATFEQRKTSGVASARMEG